MPKVFNPLSLFRRVPNRLLQRFFSSVAAFDGFDWGCLSEYHVEPVLERYNAIPTAERARIFRILRKVESLGNSVGTQVLIAAARDQRLEIARTIRDIVGPCERALWCYIEYPDVFESAQTLAHIDGLPRQSWETFKSLPGRSVDVTSEMTAELSRQISAFFWTTQCRGNNCKVEHRLCDRDVDLFFAYPADYPDESFGYDDDGAFEQGRKWNPAFEVVFRYHRLDGTTDIYSQGGWKVRQILSQIFARVVLGVDRQPETWPDDSFDLEPFKNPNITFPTDPVDNIASVRVQAIRLQFRDRTAGQVTFRVDGRRKDGTVYDVITDKLSDRHSRLSDASVIGVTLQVRLRAMEGKERSLAFNIATPSSCDLDDSPEEQMLRRYLKIWKIEKDADDLATAA